MKFGESLIRQGYVTKKQISNALLIQPKYKKIKIGRLLVELGSITQQDLDRSLTLFLGKKLTESLVEIKAKKKKQNLSTKMLKIENDYNIFIKEEYNNSIEIVMCDIINDQLLKKIENLISKDISIFSVTKEKFKFLRDNERKQEKTKNELIISKNKTDDEYLNESIPYANVIKDALKEAKVKQVSDIHIEPMSDGIQIRFRFHGKLKEYKRFTQDHKEGIINHTKTIVNMDMAIIGVPQDSRASFDSLKLDIRASSLPTLYGEKIVLRLLDQERSFDINISGIDTDSLTVLKNAVKLKDGLILISGPTGSGKTTTLYSLLCEIDSHSLNISTLENPVEYTLPNINQVHIQDGARLNFASSLRALMRQDPDVILVGEIRDEETAKLCFKAASTGHLVLSTVHANGAKEVIERISSLGIDDLSIQNNLRLSVAQRLVPLICRNCSPKIDNSSTYRNKSKSGCNSCNGSAIGRKPIIEYMDKEQIQSYLKDKTLNASKPKVTLKDHVIQLASKGLIDSKELESYI